MSDRCHRVQLEVAKLQRQFSHPVNDQLVALLTKANYPEEYINIAVNLGNNPQHLEKLRLGLRKKMQQSPLCDGKKFAKAFENACQDIWKKSLTKA